MCNGDKETGLLFENTFSWCLVTNVKVWKTIGGFRFPGNRLPQPGGERNGQFRPRLSSWRQFSGEYKSRCAHYRCYSHTWNTSRGQFPSYYIRDFITFRGSRTVYESSFLAFLSKTIYLDVTLIISRLENMYNSLSPFVAIRSPLHRRRISGVLFEKRCVGLSWRGPKFRQRSVAKEINTSPLPRDDIAKKKPPCPGNSWRLANTPPTRRRQGSREKLRGLECLRNSEKVISPKWRQGNSTCQTHYAVLNFKIFWGSVSGSSQKLRLVDTFTFSFAFDRRFLSLLSNLLLAWNAVLLNKLTMILSRLETSPYSSVRGFLVGKLPKDSCSRPLWVSVVPLLH